MATRVQRHLSGPRAAGDALLRLGLLRGQLLSAPGASSNSPAAGLDGAAPPLGMFCRRSPRLSLAWAASAEAGLSAQRGHAGNASAAAACSWWPCCWGHGEAVRQRDAAGSKKQKCTLPPELTSTRSAARSAGCSHSLHAGHPRHDEAASP